MMLADEATMKINKIPQSNVTVHMRILEMSSDVEKNVCGNKFQCSNFAQQVDESTYITNKAQLITFIRFINENQVTNQFLFFFL